MAAISQIVDDRIEQIRRERAELDELRASLERREAEIYKKEQAQNDDIDTDRKESLSKELAELSAEVNRLRAERESSIMNFGDEISKVHSEKTSESAAQIKHLQSEIAFLIKGKTELEEDIERLRAEIEDTEKKARKEQARIIEEKESLLTRTRAEREASFNELNHEHSLKIAELERQKKEIENDISAMEQAKAIEWNKLQAELSRTKTAQITELDEQRALFLAEMEKEKADVYAALRTQERKQQAEISAEKREWEKEILKYQSEKQKILDEIKLLEYDFEKTRSENLVKSEKIRLDEEKIASANRVEALAKLEEEQAVVLSQFKKDAVVQKSRLREEITNIENEIAILEAKKAEMMGEISTLETRFEQRHAENEAVLENLRLERLREIDQKCIELLAEIDEQRQAKISALEAAFLEKSSELETARSRELTECRAAIKLAVDELRELKKLQIAEENKIETLKTESMRINEENIALKKSAEAERRLELEKMASDRFSEVEQICANKIEAANERARKIEAEGNANSDRFSAEIANSTEALLELRRAIAAQRLELEKQRAERLEEIETEVINTLDVYSKMKFSKLSEIEKYLEEYKNERLEGIRSDIARQMESSGRIAALEARNLEIRGVGEATEGAEAMEEVRQSAEAYGSLAEARQGVEARQAYEATEEAPEEPAST
ncbi:MAG: hypothetical protein FWG87_10780 [Defluviitaleaceae bacterium]|nr:hypothetical protein [Defluviitaleaceae bacterium]